MPFLRSGGPKRLEFLCETILLWAEGGVMFDLLLVIAFVGVCLFIAYERITGRI
jgi:hypothetical protein